jgi:hypothetical protein
MSGDRLSPKAASIRTAAVVAFVAREQCCTPRTMKSRISSVFSLPSDSRPRRGTRSSADRSLRCAPHLGRLGWTRGRSKAKRPLDARERELGGKGQHLLHATRHGLSSETSAHHCVRRGALLPRSWAPARALPRVPGLSAARFAGFTSPLAVATTTVSYSAA